jgi:anhydro-N-acetylmuramic acid kinase
MAIMRTAIGLMSGTSLDGIDAAIIKTDGINVELTNHFISVPYKSSFKERIRESFDNPDDIADLERDITLAHETAIRLLLDEANLHPGDIDVIGFHGQTILHDPANGITKQIGDGKLLAKRTNISVVNDFRSADVENGGQGAPLVPLFHQAVFKDMKKPLAIVNIGGVANVTYLGAAESDIYAFDTGPGNALIDDWILKHTGKYFDEDGSLAVTGQVDGAILTGLMSHPYFDKVPPKSLDRNSFSTQPLSTLSVEDGAATLTAFTVQSLLVAKELFYEKPDSWIILGGGRLNKFMMYELQKNLDVPVKLAEDVGINGDAIEAQAFAFLAVRSIDGQHITLPTTTGVKSAVTGGVFYQA